MRRAARDRRDAPVEVTDERRGRIGEAAADVDHEQGRARTEPGPAVKAVVPHAFVGSGISSPARTRASASSPGSSGDQRSGVAGTGGSRPVSSLQFASTSSSGGPKSNDSASPRSSRWRARSASVAVLVGAAVVVQDDAVARLRLLARDEPERHVADDGLDGPVEPVLPAAAARRCGRRACRPARPRRRRTWRAAAPRCRRRGAGSSPSVRPARRRARPTAASASGRRGSRPRPARGRRSASRRRCRRGGSRRRR